MICHTGISSRTWQLEATETSSQEGKDIFLIGKNDMENKTRLPKSNGRKKIYSPFLILIPDIFILSLKVFLSELSPPPPNNAHDKKHLGFLIGGLFCYAERNQHNHYKSRGHNSLIFLGLPTEAAQLLRSLGNFTSYEIGYKPPPWKSTSQEYILRATHALRFSNLPLKHELWFFPHVIIFL